MAMMTVATSLALMRFGVGHGGGFFVTVLGLAVVGAVVWALIRPDNKESVKN
jgi:hypothetical protein